ncbi:MAG TPA: DUF3854 domain-containing protein [Acidimicrobiales bacterium]|nr:DUF3854 domain-containing protein [Acidimicrobiales bacterium]
MSEITPIQLHAHHITSQFADDPLVTATAVEVGCTSVDSPDQLPESLRKYRSAPPGLLFWHHPLGGGEATPQLRPDKPDEDAPKYIFPDDAGSVISITPSMQSRLDGDTTRADKVLIVEGTKQAIFATAYAPDDVVVVGILGCWGWSFDKMAVAALDDLCKGRDVVVTFDADISSNRKVYDAAAALTLALSTIGAKSVRFLKVPGSKTIGLDDFITRRPIDNRAFASAKMITDATLFNKVKKPPRASSALNTGDEKFDFISDELGEVIEAVFESIADDGSVAKEHINLTIAGTIEENGISRDVRRSSTLLRAAPRIVATVEEKDDLTPDAESTFYHDIQLQIGPKSSSTNYLIKDVLDKDLGGVRAWIARAGTAGLFASLGRGGQGINGQTKIAEAMRDLAKHSPDVERRTTLVRTGWYQENDAVYWVDSGGAHGPDGKITTIKARLEGSVSSLDIPGYLENYTMDDVVASVKTTIGVCDYLYDPTPWITGVVGTLWAMAGGPPDAVLYLVGGGGSGKSSITGALASMLGPRWGTNKAPMASVEGTEAYLSDVARQIHNCALVLDDARDRSSSRSQEKQDGALDAVIRVGYGGGGAARGKKVRDASGNWHQSSASLNRPFVIIAGETLPDSAPQSTIERCLVIEVKVDTSLKFAKDTPDKRSGLDHLLEVSESGALRPMLSFFIHGMAKESTRAIREGEVSAADVLDEKRQRFEKVRAEVTEEAFLKYWPKNVPVSPRLIQVTGTFLAGVALLVEFISEFEILNETEISLLEDTWSRSIIAAAASHSTTNLASGSEVDRIIAMVKGSIASGSHCFGIPPTTSQLCVGVEKIIDIDGVPTPCVALIPKVVGDIIKNHHNLGRRLESVLVRDKDGRLTRSTWINGDNVKCLVIRKSDYNKGVDLDDEPQLPLEDF